MIRQQVAYPQNQAPELQEGDNAPAVFKGSVEALVNVLRPSTPVNIFLPQTLTRTAQEFLRLFPGSPMYAVKCNADDNVIRTLYASGIRNFDAASIAEIRQIRELAPEAKIYFMHPIKAPESVREAYYSHGVRAFVLDYEDELHKILRETDTATDLELFVRVAVPKGNVATDFSSKFGARPEGAVALLKNCAVVASRLGVSFHVGTQCTEPETYRKAIAFVAGLVGQARVKLDALDVGGGFPAVIDADNPPPQLASYMAEIAQAIEEHGFSGIDLLSEPGRGLVAASGVQVVRVEGRKGDLLYINDGTYGGLFEAGKWMGLAYPSRLLRFEGDVPSSEIAPFRLAGPTCDSLDLMQGPFMLPADVQAGDWIALGQLGAYCEMSRTGFNGFGNVHKIIIEE